MDGMYNMRSPAVKRLMKEAQELREPTEQYAVQPLEDNLFEWHFTIRGPADTEFEGGLYHGRIILPPEYPMKPPSILILTANGRFETNKKICLSISGHHPESWQPSWSIRTALLAIIGFMPTHGAGALGSLDYTPDERKILAKRSRDFKCPACGRIDGILKPVTEESKKTTQEAKQLAAQMDFKDEKERSAALNSLTGEEKQETEQSESATEEATPAETASQPQTVPQIPPPLPQLPPLPFGQMPFRLPFMPPFPPYPVQPSDSTNGSQVPRFPLPYSPMVPPFPMMNPGSFAMPPAMPPMMPGMPAPPWNAAGIRTEAPATTASVAESNTDTDITAEVPLTEIPSPASPDSTVAAETGPDSSALENDTVPASTSADTSPTLSEPAVQDGLRHRHTQQTEPAGSGVGVSAHLPDRIDPRETTAFYIFAVVVVVLIMMLLVRRLYVMGYYKLFI